MTCDNPNHTHFNLDINSIIRSVAVVAVGLPVALSFGNLTNTTASVAALALEKTAANEAIDSLRGELTKPCIDFYVSKVDSKLERTAKNTIDDVMGGEVNHKGLCDYIVN